MLASYLYSFAECLSLSHLSGFLTFSFNTDDKISLKYPDRGRGSKYCQCHDSHNSVSELKDREYILKLSFHSQSKPFHFILLPILQLFLYLYPPLLKYTKSFQFFFFTQVEAGLQIIPLYKTGLSNCIIKYQISRENDPPLLNQNFQNADSVKIRFYISMLIAVEELVKCTFFFEKQINEIE